MGLRNRFQKVCGLWRPARLLSRYLLLPRAGLSLVVIRSVGYAASAYVVRLLQTGPMRERRRITIQDVARESGFAASTVSRVLNNNDYSSQLARQRVLEAVGRLDYKANHVARGLRWSKTMTIGLLLSDLANPIYMEFIRGAEHQAQASGYALLIADGQNSPEIQLKMLENLYDRRVDALLLRGPITTGDRLDRYIGDGIPIYPEARAGQSGGIRLEDPRDEADASREAIEHLLRLGHQRFAFFTRGRNTRDDRIELAREVLRAGELPSSALSVHIVDSAEEAKSSLAALSAASIPPTAFVVGAHVLAPLVLGAMRTVGLRLPADASFVCYGDSAWASAYDPPLSVIRFDYYRDGRLAVETVLAALEGAADRVPQRIPAVFVDRASCGPVSAGRRKG